MSAQSEPQVHLTCNPRFLAACARASQHKPMVKSAPKYMHDGDRLRVLMERAGVTQAELATAMDVSPTAVSSKWLGQGKIARDRIPLICQLLRCSSDELLGIVSAEVPRMVAEPRAEYDRPDVKALVENYLALEPASQTTLSQVGSSLAESAKVKKKSKRA